MPLSLLRVMVWANSPVAFLLKSHSKKLYSRRILRSTVCRRSFLLVLLEHLMLRITLSQEW